MKSIKLDKERWTETPHTHCIMALYEGRAIADPLTLLVKRFPLVIAQSYARAIRRFDIGRGGLKSRLLIEELAKSLGYEKVEWTDLQSKGRPDK